MTRSSVGMQRWGWTDPFTSSENKLELLNDCSRSERLEEPGARFGSRLRAIAKPGRTSSTAALNSGSALFRRFVDVLSPIVARSRARALSAPHEFTHNRMMCRLLRLPLLAHWRPFTPAILHGRGTRGWLEVFIVMRVRGFSFFFFWHCREGADLWLNFWRATAGRVDGIGNTTAGNEWGWIFFGDFNFFGTKRK